MSYMISSFITSFVVVFALLRSIGWPKRLFIMYMQMELFCIGCASSSVVSSHNNLNVLVCQMAPRSVVSACLHAEIGVCLLTLCPQIGLMNLKDCHETENIINLYVGNVSSMPNAQGNFPFSSNSNFRSFTISGAKDKTHNPI